DPEPRRIPRLRQQPFCPHHIHRRRRKLRREPPDPRRHHLPRRLRRPIEQPRRQRRPIHHQRQRPPHANILHRIAIELLPPRRRQVREHVDLPHLLDQPRHRPRRLHLDFMRPHHPDTHHPSARPHERRRRIRHRLRPRQRKHHILGGEQRPIVKPHPVSQPD